MNQLDRVTQILEQSLEGLNPVHQKGRVEEVLGTVIKATVPGVRVGELCILKEAWSDDELLAEVVGFFRKTAVLTPLGDMQGLSASTQVIATGKVLQISVGQKLLGRVLDAMAKPIDGLPLEEQTHYPIYGVPPAPLQRSIIDSAFETGLRAIDGLLTCGRGQRIGVYAGPGVGKSTLLGMLANGSNADVTVIGLIGERGREVREFIQYSLGEGLQKSVLVVSTSDRPAMERLKAAYTATAIAEYFRDQGLNVLLLMDSLTRYSRALREIGLAAGEPPTRRGFPPSVFSSLPLLLERAGTSDKGSITAFYTILVEGDDMSEPIAEETKSLLDGHIVLSQKLADSGHYPAIDVLPSLSRVMSSITDRSHQQCAYKLRSLLSAYKNVELLVRIGEYKKGSDPLADEAISKMDQINDFLRQSDIDKTELNQTVEQLAELAG
ncbi:MAG: EscN/YscN/HrcN family type III secretion system ATPase [Desulfobacteraceae bacterium]|nr:EscN/YscN/HrcN family type III secretion system ATPase [Desulfobacteraceae bacterium]